MKMRVVALGAAVVATMVVLAAALDNGLAQHPPMGWCTWNAYHRKFKAEYFLEAADAMVKNGMQAAGYTYINVDGGWWNGSDTGHVYRNSTGFPSYNPEKYPNGIKSVIDYIHSKGFKYGHYTDAGKHACNGDKPMSEGFEHQDAFLFASWGADMLKVDACADAAPPEQLMTKWRNELNATGRPILFSNCHNGCETQEWQPWCAQLSNMWRTSRDIQPTWTDVMFNLDTLKGRGKFAQPGSWNDPDFLEVDIGDFKYDGSQRLLDENQAHFTLWAITSSPLITGFNFSEASSDILNTVTNKLAIEVNQQYCCGNAGDVLDVSGLDDPWRPHPATMPCSSADKTQQWVLNRSQHICSVMSPQVCFNVQLCKTNIIAFPFSDQGCEQGTNELFVLEGDELKTLMHGAGEHKCVRPGQSASDPLQLAACGDGKGWSYDNTTSTLRYGNECVGVIESPTPSEAAEVWAKPLPGNRAAVALFNRNDSTNVTMSVDFSDVPNIGCSGTDSCVCTVQNVWANEQGTYHSGFKPSDPVRPHQAVFIVISNCKQ